MTKHEQFREDMLSAGIPVEEYKGRNFYEGPAVYTTDELDLQDIIRATTVKVMTDNMGRDLVVYPR